jgi:hypothetical protein
MDKQNSIKVTDKILLLVRELRKICGFLASGLKVGVKRGAGSCKGSVLAV